MRHRFVPLNYVLISGHCTHDPVLRCSKEGTPCLDFQIGVTTRYDGKEKRGFFQVACFGELAVTAARLRKGLPVVIVGELRDSKIFSQGRFYSRPKVLAQKVLRQTEDEPPDAAFPAPERKRRTRKDCPPPRKM